MAAPHQRTGRSAVLLLGNFRPALVIARELARDGYRVVVTSGGGEGCTEYSRFVSDLWDDPDVGADASAFSTALADYLTIHPDIDVVFPVAEAYVEAIARHRHLLPRDRTYATPADGTVLTCLDKLELLLLARSAGIPVAPFQAVQSYPELLDAAAALDFPLAVRSLDPGRRIGGSKAVLVRSAGELSEALPSWPAGHSRLLLQRKVGGARHNIYFAARRGTIIRALETVIFQTDHSNGSGLAVKGLTLPVSPQLLAWTETATRQLGYHGVGCAQFKIDLKGGSATILELNPRVTGSHAVPEAAGLQLSRLAIDLARDAVSETGFSSGAAGLRYAWTYGDLRAIKTALGGGELGMGRAAWRLVRAAWTFIRSDIHMTWRWDDPIPTLRLLAKQLVPNPLKGAHRQESATAAPSEVSSDG